MKDVKYLIKKLREELKEDKKIYNTPYYVGYMDALKELEEEVKKYGIRKVS